MYTSLMNAELPAKGPEVGEEDAPKLFEAGLIKIKLVGLRIAELVHQVRIAYPEFKMESSDIDNQAQVVTGQLNRSVTTLLRGAPEEVQDEVLGEVADTTEEKVKHDKADAEQHGVGVDFVLRLTEMASAVKGEWARENSVFAERLGSGLLTKSLTRKLDRLKKAVAQHTDEQVKDLVDTAQAAIAEAKSRLKEVKAFELPEGDLGEDAFGNPVSEAELRAEHVRKQVETIRSVLSSLIRTAEEAAEEASERGNDIRNEIATKARNPHIAALEEEDAPALDRTEVFEALRQTLENEVMRWAERTYESSGPRNSVLSDVEASANLLASSHRQLMDTEQNIARIANETKDFRRIRGDLLETRKKITSLRARLDKRKKKNDAPETEAA